MALVSRNFSDIVTFTRASAKYGFNSSGLASLYAVDAPVLDFDPATLAARGFLIEEQRTCLSLWNRDLTNAVWTATNITPAKDQTGIDGVANSASKITATAANGTILQSVTSASAARATCAWVKRITGSGTVEMTQNGGTNWTAITVGASWAKVELASATVTNPSIGFRLATSGDAIAVDFFMLESASFSSISPIATTTAQVTRSADVATINTLSPWYSATAGTLLIRVKTSSTATNASLASFDDNSTNNRIQMRRNSTGPVVGAVVASGGVVSVNLSGGTFTAGASTSVALAYQTNDLAVYLGGASAITSATVTVPTVTQLQIGNGAGQSALNGWIERMVFYPIRKTNAELATLTS